MAKKPFSERIGVRKACEQFQVGSMSDGLRSKLWNSLDLYVWADANRTSGPLVYMPIRDLVKRIWFHYFKRPLDTIPPLWDTAKYEIRQFFFDAEWVDAFEFVEFLVDEEEEESRKSLIEFLNNVLASECSGYRFVNSELVQITSTAELESIDSAISDSRGFGGASEHLSRAMELLSDKKSPDFRNSVKESISAVESACNAILGTKGTLGDALKSLEGKIKIHASLTQGFLKLYGYTSDEGGIRHGLKDQADGVALEDARYMLISCSAFINYLIAKSADAGIKVKK